MYLNLDQIEKVHIELTSKCNLMCPMCARVDYDYIADNYSRPEHRLKINPNLAIKELDWGIIKKVFNKKFSSQLDLVYINGNYGDFVASDNSLHFLEHCRHNGVKRLQAFTNAGIRPSKWWVKVAKILNGPKDLLVFSIDGLADTNHLYRVNSEWKTVMRNAKAFINAGGKARWDFLVFEHNKHQIEKARTLAKEMGFIQFSVKYSDRWHDDVRNCELEEVLIKKNNKKWFLRPVSVQKNKNSSKLEPKKVFCRTKKEKNIYIDHRGDVWPCCWLASMPYAGKKSEKYLDYQKLIKSYGEGFNSLRSHSLEEIINHRWLSQDLASSWTNCNKILSVCASKCY